MSSGGDGAPGASRGIDRWSGARWIAPPGRPPRGADRPSPLLRREFTLPENIDGVTLQISALGIYDVSINGQPVSDDRLRPGFTAYDHRIQFQTYDVTALVRSGANAIGITLADGWWRGRVGVFRQPNNWGKQVAAIARLEAETGSGTFIVNTDSSWRVGEGGVRSACLFHGETFDARLEPRGWAESGYDDSEWSAAAEIDGPTDRLVAQQGPSVRPGERLPAKRVFKAPNGETVVDFGQNLAGVSRFEVRGRPGDVVRLTHGETLDVDGNFTAETFGHSKQQVVYTLVGDPDGETFEPRFTYHGFRYALIESWPSGSTPTADDFEAVLLTSDTPQTGTFECSHAGLNQLVQNIDWSQRSNFVEIPTDCPTREKAGWTGDIAMFARTGAFNRDIESLLKRWLYDVRADQLPDGRIPCVVPVSKSYNAPFMKPTHGAAAWSDACVLVPWTLYEVYGDAAVLDENYNTMIAWVRALERRAKRDPWWRTLDPRTRKGWEHHHIIEQGFQWAEWLPPGENLRDNWLRGLLKPDPLIATAFYANTLRVVGDIARILGRERDAHWLDDLRAHVVQAVRAELFKGDGLPRRRDQIGLVAVLAFDLVAERSRSAAGDALAAAVRANGKRLSTGFTMTPLLCPTLVEAGHVELAYDVLLAEEVPSWLYPISKGATTTWETWDAIAPDGSTSNVSQNHYAFGAVGEFLHRFVAGIDTDPERPGYEHIVIRPVPDPARRLSHASASFESVRGLVSSAWQLTADELELTVEIPSGSTATIHVPGQADPVTVPSGPHTLRTGWQ